MHALYSKVIPLALTENPAPVLQAWHELVNALARIQIVPDRFSLTRPSLARPGAAEAAIWKASRPVIARYQQQVPLDAPAWEYLKLLGDALVRCEDSRRLLLTRFHYDARHGVLYSKRVLVRPYREAALDTLLHYRQYENVFHSCLLAVRAAQQAGHNLQNTLQVAVRAMRTALFEGIEWQIMFSHQFASAACLEITTLMLAGWVRPQLRMYPSHRKALSESGEPRTVLEGWLPGWVWDATHDGVQTPRELVKAVRHRLDAVRQKSPRRTRATIHSQGQSAQRSRRQSQPRALEGWQSQEEMRLDCSASKERVKLSTKESLVLELRLQGWKIREIAAQPGVEVGTIKREIFRAKTKLAKAKHR